MQYEYGTVISILLRPLRPKAQLINILIRLIMKVRNAIAFVR